MTGIMRFTDRGIAALKPRSERYEVWDGSGFGVRVTPRGTKSFVFVYHFDGQPRRMTIGKYPGVSLADAGVAVAEARKALEKGEDPARALVAERKAERKAETVDELCDLYLEMWARPRKRSADDDERILAKDVRPRWGKRKAKNVSRPDVIAMLDEIVARGSPVMANRVLATVRRMFNFAIPRGIVDVNPCWKVETPAAESARDRCLDDDEIVAFLTGLNGAEMSTQVRLALLLTLATAQRSGEVVAAELRRINEKERTWLVPGVSSKNKLDHIVPLSPLALRLIEEARVATPKRKVKGDEPVEPSPWLFEARVGGGKEHITQRALAHSIRDNRDLFEIEPFAPHDLRRSAATAMRRLGVSAYVVGRVLNHVDPSVTRRHYDAYDNLAEKRAALEGWGKHLELLIARARTRQAVSVGSTAASP